MFISKAVRSFFSWSLIFLIGHPMVAKCYGGDYERTMAIKATIEKLNGQYIQDGLGNIVDVHFGARTPADAKLDFLVDLPELKSLAVVKSKLGDASLECLPKLKKLEVLGCSSAPNISDETLKRASNLDQLLVIGMDGTGITDAGLRHIVALPKLYNLSIDETAVTDAGLEIVADIPNLKLFWCSNTKITDAGIKHLSKARKLTYLVLAKTDITDAGLAAIGSLPELHTLLLNDTAIGDAGLAHLVTLPKLVSLQLGNTQATSAGMQYIANIRTLKQLEIGNDKIEPRGLDYFVNHPQELEVGGEGSGITREEKYRFFLKWLRHRLPEMEEVDKLGGRYTYDSKLYGGRLHLNENFSDEQVDLIISVLKSTRSISFHNSRITDQGLHKISTEIFLKSMVFSEFDFSDSGDAISPDRIKKLRDLKHGLSIVAPK